MKDFRIAVAQFEPVSLDKEANLKTVTELTLEARERGAQVVCFHEQCLVGYNMWGEAGDAPGMPPAEEGRVSPHWSVLGVNPARHAEPVPGGPGTRALEELAARCGVVVMAGLPERSSDDCAYNTYVIVGPDGYIGKYRKCHLVPGREYQYFRAGGGFPIFDVGHCKMGVLICYDNHFPEAHRILAVRGAQLIVMPHVTVGRGWWPEGEVEDAMRQAKNWVLTWCRARAFDNSAYVVFVNEGSDSGEGSLGCSMVLDPDGHVIAEASRPGRDLIVVDLKADLMQKIRHRTHDYLKFRRPELYGPLSDPGLGIDP